jgi:hypothetical protein
MKLFLVNYVWMTPMAIDGAEQVDNSDVPKINFSSKISGCFIIKALSV